MEEFDPLFGIDGYRQIDGTRSSPTGFGIRVAKDLTLLDAKSKYRTLEQAGIRPLFLKTVVFIDKWLRTFEVLTGEFPDKKAAKTQTSLLEENHPALEIEVVPY